MTSENVKRWAGPGAVLMATAWFASGIVAFAAGGFDLEENLGEPSFYAVEALHGIGELGLLVALIGIHLHHLSSYGRLGRIGFWASAVGTVSMVISTAVGLFVVAATGEANLLVGALFGIGLLSWLIGFPALGVAMLRARLMPAWVGTLVVAFIPLIVVLFFVFVAYGAGGIVVGVVWLLLGYALWSQRPMPSYEGTSAGPAGASP